ncbi:LHFPL tetraspan subfamily member 3 protein-like [Tubulanus polymorphus]|uniref:LHFPL tetraspan subfamily member 3 protein-like n=1 Tax=Tubulanus polymorphus TaxID=672921 RepID=UPI003DA1DF44
MEVHQYSETTRIYHSNYVRNSRAIGVMWGIFTICFAIINIVVFIQPQWIGDTPTSPGTGYFGLFEYCELYQTGHELKCTGRFDDFTTILHPAFKAASFFVGFSALLILICICCMLLFLFMSTSLVFMICGVMQVIAGICMFLGCIVYPAGWGSEEVKGVCGSTAKFNRADCGIRWAYILAIIGIFDALVLATLAFVLASRQAKLLPEGYTPATGTLTKSDYDYIEKESLSKHSEGIHPVLTVPEGDARSHYSSVARSHHSDFAL